MDQEEQRKAREAEQEAIRQEWLRQQEEERERRRAAREGWSTARDHGSGGDVELTKLKTAVGPEGDTSETSNETEAEEERGHDDVGGDGRRGEEGNSIAQQSAEQLVEPKSDSDDSSDSGEDDGGNDPEQKEGEVKSTPHVVIPVSSKVPSGHSTPSLPVSSVSLIPFHSIVSVLGSK